MPAPIIAGATRRSESYEDVPGFCKSATLEEVRENGHVLTPGRYVGTAAVEDDGVPFEEKFAALTSQLEEQFVESDRLTGVIRERLSLVKERPQARMFT